MNRKQIKNMDKVDLDTDKVVFWIAVIILFVLTVIFTSI